MSITDDKGWAEVERKAREFEMRPRCECGSNKAYWHGPRSGLRQYLCDDCYKAWKTNNPDHDSET